jgi:hypothetical protein
MKFSSGILVLASVVITSFAASIPKIEADIHTISSSVAALDKSVTALPSKGANLIQAFVSQHSGLFACHSPADVVPPGYKERF